MTSPTLSYDLAEFASELTIPVELPDEEYEAAFVPCACGTVGCEAECGLCDA